MSMRTIARSSSKRKSASDLASSVLPVPVGPRKRNEPVGRLGSAMPARERRTASLTARTASRWPISRSPMTSSIRSSLAVSPSSSRPVGMPVQASTTSAICSAPTSSPTSGSSSERLGLLDASRSASRARGSGRRGSRWPRRGCPRAVSLSASIAQLVELAAQLALALERGLLRSQRASSARSSSSRSARSARSRGEPLDGGVVGLLLERELLHLQPVDLAAELVDLLRARTRSPSAAGTPPRR